MIKKVFNRGNAAGIVTVIVLLVLWEVIARIKQTVYVPPVSTIFLTFIKEWFSPTFGQQAIPSLYRMTVGYFFASVVGISIGIVIGSFKKIYHSVSYTHLRAHETGRNLV